jgi:hypothetical protein
MFIYVIFIDVFSVFIGAGCIFTPPHILLAMSSSAGFAQFLQASYVKKILVHSLVSTHQILKPSPLSKARNSQMTTHPPPPPQTTHTYTLRGVKMDSIKFRLQWK